MENNKYRLKVVIKSEAIFNSGEEDENLVNQKVLADKYGRVYFHAKSLKGELKNTAYWILEQYKLIDSKRAKSFLNSIIKLFGINSEEIKLHFNKNDDSKGSIQGIINLSNLELDNRTKSWIKQIQLEDREDEYYRITPQDFINAQTNVRTSIKLKNGVVEDKMMTTYHTVKNGLAFYSYYSNFH